MIPVNPPPAIRLPQAFTKDPELRAYFKNFNHMILQLWKRTGGGEDLVDVAINNNADLPVDQLRNQIKILSERIEELEGRPEILPNNSVLESDISDLQASITPVHVDIREFRSVEVIEAYTASDRDFMKVATSAEILLPLFPAENTVIIAINGHTNSINISGNGRTINGHDGVKSVEQNTFLTFYYFLATDEWFMTVAVVEDAEHKSVLIGEQESINESLKAVIFCLETIANIDHGSAIGTVDE